MTIFFLRKCAESHVRVKKFFSPAADFRLKLRPLTSNPTSTPASHTHFAIIYPHFINAIFIFFLTL